MSLQAEATFGPSTIVFASPFAPVDQAEDGSAVNRIRAAYFGITVVNERCMLDAVTSTLDFK